MIVLKTILTRLDEQDNTKLSKQPPFTLNEHLTYICEKRAF